jgi:poly-gamma-glutamate synthesis protein (capsule biosynthesis protein)
MRPVSVYEDEPAFGGLVHLLRSATAAFTNFELNVFDTRKFQPTPQAEYGGLWLHATPDMAKEIKWMGFDMVSRANNHTTDYGVEGMNETDAILDESGLIRAGSGQTLGQAQAPGYFQTPFGRVAMISLASTFLPMSRAMDARPDFKGRPGLSALRKTRNIYLEPWLFDQWRSVTLNDLRGGRPLAVSPPADEFNFFGVRIRKGEKTRVEEVADERDVKALLTQVKSARRQADFVFVTIHSHEPGNDSEVPADFLPPLARAVIDAGADMFVGHGPHRLRGIEIYKGKPIFYSLGNFMFHCYTLEAQGADVFEATSPHLDIFNSTIADLFDARTARGLEGVYSDRWEEAWWQSALAIAKFGPGKLLSVELYPLELGTGMPRSQIGTPRLAGPSGAKKIIDELDRLSKPFSTKIQFVKGIGVIDLQAQEGNSR